VFVRLDTKQYIQGIEEFEEAMRIANYQAVYEIQGGLESLIFSVFEEALLEAGEGFPTQYAEHLAEGLAKLSPKVTATDVSLIVETFDFRTLGDRSDIYEAFHYHAILAVASGKKGGFDIHNPPQVELPYQGQALHADVDRRYEVWEAIYSGATEIQVQFRGHSSTIDIPAGLWEETIAARIGYWRSIGAYPEYILLDAGQTEWSPTITPTRFISLMEERILEFMEEIWQAHYDSILDRWNNPAIGHKPIDTYFDTGVSRFRDPGTGRFIKGGH
jgi:hypothetical protein